MFDRIFGFSGLVSLGFIALISVANSVELQSVLALFATLFAFSAIASSTATD